MILSAQSIRKANIFDPFHERTVANGMSFGLSSHGYDIRIEQEIILEPHEFALASTIEHFTMPNNLAGIVHDKSSWARQGLSVFNTVLEASWKGFLTLELKNQSNTYIHIRAGSPIAQVVFHVLDEPTEQPYSGKYQNQQRGPVPAKVELPK